MCCIVFVSWDLDPIKMSKRKPVIRKAKPEPPVVKQEVESDEENNVEAQMIQVKQEVKEEPVDEVEAENVEEQRG